MKKRERRDKIVIVQEEKLESVQGGSGYNVTARVKVVVASSFMRPLVDAQPSGGARSPRRRALD